MKRPELALPSPPPESPRMTPKNNWPLATTIWAVALLSACGSLPAENSDLMAAREAYSAAQANARTVELAPAELKLAGEALNRANAAMQNEQPPSAVTHQAYLARQSVALAEARGQQVQAERDGVAAASARDQQRLAARTTEADNANRNANQAQRQTAVAVGVAQASQRDAAAAEQRTADAQRVAAEADQRTADAQRVAAAANVSAADERAYSQTLEARLQALAAKQTERGLIITFSDLLFDTDSARLGGASADQVTRLADFFRQYPQRRASIEGYTDSTGGTEHNKVLSGRRAEAVRAALISQGVDASRLSAQGLGQGFPVAGNDNAAGRQANRRVEIVLSDVHGRVAPR